MRKYLAAVLVLAGMAQAVSAEASKPHPFLGLGLGAGFRLGDFGSGYGEAISGQLQIGYDLGGNFAILLASQSSIFMTSLPGIGLSETLLVPTARLAIGEGNVHPYLAAGVGLAIQTAHSPGGDSSTSYLALQEGAGAIIEIQGGLDIFVEGKFTQVTALASSTRSFLPITAGLILNL